MSSMKISDLFSVADKVVVVTGGGRGIGKMITQGFVENGARVYISSRKLEDLKKTADEFGSLGVCEYVQADLATKEGRQGLIDAIAEKEGGLDVLVNNAGFGWVEPLEEFSEEGYDKVMDINVKKFAFHFSDRNVRFNTIAPGAFVSRMQPTLFDEEGRRSKAAAAPLKRIGEPTDMAGIAIYFASPASENVTGAVAVVDAGWGLT